MRLRLSLLVVASLLFAFSTFPSVDGCCCPGGYTCGCNFFGCSCVYPVCKADYNYKVSHHTKPVDEYGRRCGANHYKGEKPCDRALDGPLDKFSAIDRDSNEFISMDEAKAMSVLNGKLTLLNSISTYSDTKQMLL